MREGDSAIDAPAKRAKITRIAPAKHGKPEQRVVVPSPTKIDGRFKASKTAIDVYQDGKDDFVPTTPRHRDALSKKAPVTPRHRLIIAGAHATPRSSPSASTAVYNQARRLFARCANPGKLVGREVERSELTAFIDRCLDSTAAGCLYVSGPPGTGKSALVDEICRQYHGNAQLQVSTVNCMSVRNAKDLASKLADGLGLQENSSLAHLRSCLTQGRSEGHEKYLVILDEIDRLVDLDLALLYSLFEWSLQPTSRLILVGIANALDLTDRFLPRLKTRDLRLELLPVMPYSATQTADVLTAKLRSLPGAEHLAIPPFLHPSAIQFCAKKVAAQTGDLRKAFDICRRAIDLVERETRDKDAQAALQLDSPSKTPLMENINLSSPSSSPSAPRSPSKSPCKRPAVDLPYTLATAPRATIAHMAKITAQAFSNGATQRLSSLNLQQKAVLCSLAALEKHNRAATSTTHATVFAPTTPRKTDPTAPTIRQLHASYATLCRRGEMLQPLSGVEFRDVVAGLEALGLLAAADGKAGSLGALAAPLTPSRTPGRRPKSGFVGVAAGDDKRVGSVLGEREVRAALDGAGGELLRGILDGEV